MEVDDVVLINPLDQKEKSDSRASSMQAGSFVLGARCGTENSPDMENC